MKYVKITVDDVTYNLIKNANETWTITNRAPLSSGDYLMTITVTTDSGQEIVIDTTDEELLEAVTLLVRNQYTEYGNRMLNYYPEVIKVIEEFKAITHTEGFEIDFLKSEVTFIINDAYLTTMDENRIVQWENALHIIPDESDTVEDRRDVIIAIIRGSGKLNTALINSIVGSFTNGGTAISYISDSVLYVKVLPPVGNKQYKFINIQNALQKKVPAHIGLVVTRHYATWEDIKENFTSWNDIYNQDNWEALKLYIAP